MSRKVDYEKKKFESDFLKEFSAITKFTQLIALKVARQYVEDILILYNDGYSASETARYILSLINVDEIKASQYSIAVNSGWR